MKSKEELIKIYESEVLNVDEKINEFTGNFKGREIVPAGNEFNTIETVEKQNLILTIIKTWKGTPGSCKYNEADLLQTRLNLEDVEMKNRINAYIEGEEDPELQSFFTEQTIWNLEYYFNQGNDVILFEGIYYIIKQHDHEAQKLEIILNPDYNIIPDYITDLDGYYYDVLTEIYNSITPEEHHQQYNRYTVQQEAINDICWNITQEYIESYPAGYSDLKPELTAEEVEAFYTPEYREILEAANLQELTRLIQKAYKQIIKDIKENITRNYHDKYISEVYFEELYNIESYYINHLDELQEALE